MLVVLSISLHHVSADTSPARPKTFHVPSPVSYASVHGIVLVSPDELWISRSDKMNAPVYLEIWDTDKMVRKSILRPPGFATQRQVLGAASNGQFITGYDTNENALLWRIGNKQSSNLGIQFWSSREFSRSGEDFIVGISSHKAQPKDGTLLPLKIWKLGQTLTKNEITIKAPKGFGFVCGGNYLESDPWFDLSSDGSLGAVAIYQKADECENDLLYQHILIFNANSGQPLRIIKVSNNNQLVEFTFMPDGRLALLKNLLVKGTRSSKDAIEIWNPQTGMLALKFQQTAGRLVFSFSPDGRLLATGDQQRIQLWDTQNGKLLRNIKMPEQRNWTALFSPDSSTLATFDGYHKLIFWPLH